MRGLHGPAATSSVEQQVEQEAEDAKVAAIALENAEEYTTATTSEQQQQQQQQSPYQYPTKRPRRTSFNTSAIDDNEHISLSNPRILPNLDEVTNDENSEELADVSQREGRGKRYAGDIDDSEVNGYEKDYNNIIPSADIPAATQQANDTVIDKEERKRLKKERLKQEKRSKAQANQLKREMDLDESPDVIMKEGDLGGS